MKKIICNIVILSSKMKYMCYIFKINNMKNISKNNSKYCNIRFKNDMFLKINDMK